ncbi:uncharacterized protein PGTG_22131 [Puccinia graminis f. sp. tritici CRL 75-36-700-3]|uniref:Reverse transcriptase domain-containing protein n=1 Tax=Puccinia graminis f. sp. tritici (strain CRL 75-36-700-3 / race SCCL) TaxID=418459 RepID=H6QTJ2_PUCGT|nr:uncharacterized protein PGTG_22131 [Puccinia graminis f. sp. tritici CRL 75-36-700-3]EHS64207.1 hypothetical protein PGTG_22131 [Puccinia graminis f. sp. tritici CRL 75-36-700-3]
MASEFNLVKIFRWVDDNLFVKNLTSETEMKDIIARSVKLGVLTNEQKCSVFSDEQKFIGFLLKWSSPKPWAITLRETRPEESADLSLLGQIEKLRCYLRGLYRWLIDWFDLNARRYTPQDVFDDLTRWSETLNTFKHTRLISSSEPIDIGWVGDASTSFGVGVMIGKYWSQLKILKERNVDLPKRNIAWLETVAVRVGLIMLQQLNRFKKGSNLLVWTDNTTTESVIEKRKSGDKHVNDEWKIIQDLLLSEEVDLTGKRVKSDDNIADKLSRGESCGLLDCNRVLFRIPDEWVPYLCHT